MNEDDSPGTPLGRFNTVAEYTIKLGLCSGLEAKPAELFLIEEVERLQAEVRILREHLDHWISVDAELRAEIERLRSQNAQMDVALKKAHDEIDRITGWGLPK